jgi:PAS domain S-box-containing protein
MLDKALKDLLTETKPYDVTYQIKRKNDGKVRIIHSKADFKTGSNLIFGVISDITEQVELMEQLSAMDQKWKGVIESSPVPMAINNEKSEITFLNTAFTKILGYTIEDIPTLQDWFMKAYPDPIYQKQTADKWEEEMEKFIRTGIPIPSMEFEVCCKNGTYKNILFSNAWLGEAEEKNQLIVLYDMTERVSAEAKIRQKDIEFQKLSLNVSDLIFQFTRRTDGSYFVPIASQGIKNIFGCNAEDVADNFEPIARVIHPDDMERVITDIETSAKNLSFFTCEFRVQIPGREVQWIYSKSNPELLPDGSVTWYGFNTDITARIKAEEKLLQLSKAVEQSPVTIVITDTQGNIQYTNPAFSKTTGYTPEEALGHNPRILKSGETGTNEYKKMWEAISNGKKWSGEFHNKRKDGSLYWESATIAPVIDNKGVIKNYLAIKMDITESKKAQVALEESIKKYNLISKATHDSIWDLDLISGKLVQTENDKDLPQVISYSQSESDWKNLIHPEDIGNFLKTQQLALQNPQAHYWEHEYRMLNHIGKFIFVNSKGYIVRDGSGKAIRLIGASQDISERVTHLKAIEAQNKQLQEIAWIQSHIVRAPLARIMGLIDLLKVEEELPSDMKELLGHILNSAEEFDKIIKTISNKSQLVETEKLP